MVNMLWEVAYGVFKEALHLNLLEDFIATKADLMELKNDILATWKSRDKHKTSSLGPTFIPSSARASERKSTLGDTFSPTQARVPAPIHLSILSGSSCGPGGTQSPLVKTLGLPPGIPYPSMSMSYGQGIFPTLSYSLWGLTMGYNFDPMMGQPLRPISSPYSFLSQSPEMLLSTSFGLCLADLLGLLDIDDEGPPPLVVEPPAHSSHVVTGGTVPTITISSSVVETTLSASPKSSPRVSTSSTSTVGRDMQRVIQQHPPTSVNKALVQAGVG